MGYRINHSKVVSQANTIADCASRLSEQANQLSFMEQSIRSAWKGQASDVFFSRVSSIRGEVNTARQQIATLASTIKYCADRIQREDDEAMRRAANLKSGI